MNKFAKMTLAAMAVEAASVESAQSLIQQALLNVEAGSAAAMHLENAMSAMTETKFTDAEILSRNSQNVNVPIDEKRALTLKVSPTYTLDSVNSVTLKSSERLLVTTPSSPSERSPEESPRTPATTTTLPSP